MIILFMNYSRKIKWKLLLSITGNEYQKNLFRIGIKASPGIGQRKTEKKTLFWKMQLLRCRRWHSCLEQPEAQYIQFLIIRSIVIFFEVIVIAEKKRITKESFQKFLKGQDRYKLDPSNDYEELAQEQNIALANFRRKKLSQTGIRGSNGNIGN